MTEIYLGIVSSFKLETMLKYISITVIFLRYFEPCNSPSKPFFGGLKIYFNDNLFLFKSTHGISCAEHSQNKTSNDDKGFGNVRVAPLI